MKLLDKKTKKELAEVFKGLKDAVTLKFFTQEMECQFCKEMHTLLEEVCEISDKLKLEIFDFVKDKKVAEEYHIDKIPALVVMKEKDLGIRFFGIPSGYEFASLIESFKLVSKGELMLSQDTRKFLGNLKKNLHIQVFVTPTCPYCMGAVVLAHQFAYFSDRVRADMVEVIEFPHLAEKYRVMGVPRIVINEKTHIEGSVPEKVLIDHIKKGLK